MIQIPLAGGRVALIDDCDAHLAVHRWHAAKHRATFYAKRQAVVDGRKRTVYLHRAVLGAPVGVEVDHRNMDGLDCRRENLRAATRSQNAWNTPAARTNTSGVKNVSWDKGARKWSAKIPLGGGRRLYLGLFSDLEEAARAVDAAVLVAHGPFARRVTP